MGYFLFFFLPNSYFLLIKWVCDLQIITKCYKITLQHIYEM